MEVFWELKMEIRLWDNEAQPNNVLLVEVSNVMFTFRTTPWIGRELEVSSKEIGAPSVGLQRQDEAVVDPPWIPRGRLVADRVTTTRGRRVAVSYSTYVAPGWRPGRLPFLSAPAHQKPDNDRRARAVVSFGGRRSTWRWRRHHRRLAFWVGAKSKGDQQRQLVSLGRRNRWRSS